MTPEAAQEKRDAHADYMRSYKVRFPKYRAYDMWRLMVRRCEDPRHKNFARYGARGIKLCDAWHDFDVFWTWAQSSGYEPGLQIDRINNEGPYAPENCRWTTSKANNRNRGNNKLSVEKVAQIRRLLSEGVSGPKIAAQFGVHHSMIYLIKKNKKWL